MKKLFTIQIINSLAQAGFILDVESHKDFTQDLDSLFEKIPEKFRRPIFLIPILLLLPHLVKTAINYVKNKYGLGAPQHPLEAIDQLKNLISQYIPE